jgi:alkylation response protein AidB-like acyl-CoA dehydrogenase
LSDEAERLGRIPQVACDLLAGAGFYQMYLPRVLGGLELPPATVFEVIEELSIGDGSVGWCVMNATGICLTAGWLDPDVAKALFGPQPDIRVAGSLRPLGRAWPVEGGYRISGEWNFASGLHNANWLYCPCQIMDGERQMIGPTGAPLARSMWLPLAGTSVQFLDRWSVMGLRATGSDDFIVDGILVPAAHSISVSEKSMNSGPLYRSRTFLGFFHLLFAANALGIARGAIDQVIEIAGHRASSLSPILLRDRPLVQDRIGQAQAIVMAARSSVLATLERCWAAVWSEGDVMASELAQLRLAIVHAIKESVRVVDLLFAAAGTNSIYTVNGIERRFRDIHVAAQHFAAFPIHYESGGKVMMGLTPSEPGW